MVINEIIEPLVRLEGTSTRPIPWLAESWETADSQTWTFKLREGVTFHDGTPFNAEAVKFNLDRVRDPNNEYRFGRTFEYYNYEFGETLGINEVNVVDEYTVEIVLSQPSAVLLNKLSLGFAFGMNSPTAVMEQGDVYGTPAGSAVGTGPFKFVEWVPDDRITVDRNDEWWGPAAEPGAHHLALDPGQFGALCRTPGRYDSSGLIWPRPTCRWLPKIRTSNSIRCLRPAPAISRSSSAPSRLISWKCARRLPMR